MDAQRAWRHLWRADVIERVGSDLYRAFVDDEMVDPVAYPAS